jgi:hypothetical protein
MAVLSGTTSSCLAGETACPTELLDLSERPYLLRTSSCDGRAMELTSGS